AVHSAWALWLLGHPDRAAARMGEGLARARAQAYPFTLANASHFAASFHRCRRDPAAVRQLVDSGVLDSPEHGFELLTIMAGLCGGWRAGDPDAMRSAVFAFRDHAGGIGLPTFLGYVVESFDEADRVEDAASALADARAMSAESGARYWDAELARLEGTLLL